MAEVHTMSEFNGCISLAGKGAGTGRSGEGKETQEKVDSLPEPAREPGFATALAVSAPRVRWGLWLVRRGVFGSLGFFCLGLGAETGGPGLPGRPL